MNSILDFGSVDSNLDDTFLQHKNSSVDRFRLPLDFSKLSLCSNTTYNARYTR